jgi:hypothetical protein
MRSLSLAAHGGLIAPGYLLHRQDEPESEEVVMLARLAIMILAAVVGMGIPVAAVAGDEAYRAREEDLYVVSGADDDDDGDTGTGNTGGDTTSNTSGDNSNDGTNSKHSAVSRDRDRSRGDLTKDRTRDGSGGPKRDWSRNHTNDRSRNDTR